MGEVSYVGYKVGDKVWDKFLKRYDVITGVHITIDRIGFTKISYKLENHTNPVTDDGIQKDDVCICPPKKNDGSPFDGVSYYCEKHGR